jgi:ABC-type Fe3+-hydroxamate transport system substrate-binding protein
VADGGRRPCAARAAELAVRRARVARSAQAPEPPALTALVDALGIEHSPAGGDARIVSLVPSITELVCELGLAPQLVGRTGFCVHPRATLKAIPKVGGTKDVDLDALRALRATHAIVNIDENRKETVEAIAGFVPHVIVTHPLAPRDNLALYRLSGGIFGREREAEALCARFEAAYADAERAAAGFAPQRVLYLIWRDPWMTVSRDTYIARTLASVNWETMPEHATARYPEVALDERTLGGVDLVLASSEPYMFRERHVAELAAMPALAGKRVALVDGEMTSWYGSRAIAGLVYLPRFRHSLENGAH